MSNNGLPQMPAPVCLIENTDNGLQTVESSLNLLRGIQQPVVVVAVVGLYRTGKSYLMNRLAGQQSGFALGSTIESKTKGIWMWCVPHPLKSGHCLLLLDTEGLGDVDKGDSKNDAWIFCLAVLLSSTLVYNSRGTIDNQAIEKLHYVTELTDQIQVKSGAASNDNDEEMPEDCQFVRFFPGFVWAVRDFTLERKIDGRDVSEDEYLDFALNLKKGLSPKVVTYNLPRQCIRNFFPTRKCFTFPFPTAASNMTHLDSMAETDLEPDFRRVADRFCNYIFAESRVKTVQGGHKVNGSRFSHLVKIYVDTINSGSVPCLENAVVAMAEIENQSAVNEGFRLFEQGMDDLRKNFPIDLGQLSVEHQRLEAMATQVFLKRSFKDEGGKYMTQLQEKVGKFYEQLINENMEASERFCRKLLFDLYAPMAANIQQGTYAKAGGYEIYCRDRDAMVATYRQHGKKGMKGEEVLEEFLQEKNSEANAILMADERLTDADKQMAEAHEQARVQEQKVKAAARRQEDLERALEDEKRNQEERIKRMEEKIEEEKRLQREELDRALESKLKEQKEMLEKGFKDRAEIMGQEIEQLKTERQQQSEPGFFKKVFMPVAKLEEAQKMALLEQANKAEEEKCQQLQSLYEEEKKSHEENLNRLKEKQRQEYKLLASEQQRALESKLAEQREMLQKGFQQQEQELKEQIQQLRREQAQREAEEARLRLEEDKQATQATMQMLGNTAEIYYNYKMKREDRRHQQLLAEKEKYAYKKKKLAMSGGGTQLGGTPKVGEVPQDVGASRGGLAGGQTEV